MVIGDFPAEEAREFYDELVGRACSDTDWRQVYDVSSGDAPRLFISVLATNAINVIMCQACMTETHAETHATYMSMKA